MSQISDEGMLGINDTSSLVKLSVNMTSTYVIGTGYTTTDEGIINKSDQKSVAGRVILKRVENAFYI